MNRPLTDRYRGTPEAFTLIELVLVLVILSTLATVALEMIEPQVDQSRFESTQTTVSNVNDAIVLQSIASDGRTTVGGFYADLGRLPVAVSAVPADPIRLSLRELWDPTLLPSYQALPASAANVSTQQDADGQNVFHDSSVTLAFGWRGPYLQLPVGATDLRDGWGIDLISVTDGSRYSHLRGPLDSDVASIGDPIVGVRSLGRDNQIDNGDELIYEFDMPRQTDALPIHMAQLQGSVNGVLYVAKAHAANATDLVVQVYFPDPQNAVKIAIERATVTPRGSLDPNFDLFDYQFQTASGQPVPLAIGPRVIRGYWNNPNAPDSSGDFGDGTGDPDHVSIVTRFTLGTQNHLDLTIP